MDLVVRVATATDAAALHEVAAATFALACPPATTQASIDAFIAANLSEIRFAGYLADPDRALFLAEADGAAVGYTMIVLTSPTDPDVVGALTRSPAVELSKVYVLPDFHGGGVASALVDASIERARQHGAAGIWLGVNQQNIRANRFYEKKEFALVGVKKFRVGEKWEDDFVRERTL